MSDQKRYLDSLFEAAVQIQSAAERAAYLQKSCGDDLELRKKLERLLQSDRDAGSFLEQPAAELEAVRVPKTASQNLTPSLNSRATQSLTRNLSVSIGNSNHSVLRTLCQTIAVPQVMLREAADVADEPIIRPASAEMPQRDPTSRYRLDGEIARGGMGAILKGRDTDLGRDLAIKVLLDVHKDKPEVIQRFVEEAQIGGQLQHPGIAPVYELGQFADKRPFFSMKLVKGETLAKLLAARAEPAVDRGKTLGIFEQICQTMAYAHSRGVIHRDLKPANIMVGAFGEVQVMDWGLAKVLPAGGVADEKRSLLKQQGQSIIQTLRNGPGSDAPGMFGTLGSQTQMGSVMGTPAYMPPEQALGEIDNLDERADVFGLGAILCEILTGKPPYVAQDGAQVFRMASRGKLGECLSRLEACGADVELIALAKKCLNPEPNDRPSDAGVLAAHVAGYLESVETKLRATELERAAQSARAESEMRRVEQQQRSARKLRMVLGGMAIVTLVAGVACIAALLANKRANEFAEIADGERQIAKKEAVDAEAARQLAENSRLKQERLSEELLQRQGISEFILAKTAYEQGDLHVAAERLSNIPSAQRGWEWGYYQRLLRGGLFSLYGHSGFLHAVVFSPDGTRIATCSEDKTAKVWDASTGTLLLDLKGHTRSLYDVAFSPDGLRILTGGLDKPKVWDAQTGAHILDLNGQSEVNSVAYSPDGTQIVTASSESAKVWDASTGKLLIELKGKHDGVAFSPDGKRFVTGFEGNLARVWDVKTGAPLLDLKGHTKIVSCMAFSPDGTRIATGGHDRIARMWDANSGKLLFQYPVHGHVLLSVAFSSDGLRVVTGCNDSSARVWDAHSPTLLLNLKGLAAGWAEFSPDGARIVTGSFAPCTATVWDARTGTRPLDLQLDSGDSASVTYSPDGGQLLTPAAGSTAAVWDPLTLTQLNTFEGHTGAIECVSYSSDGSKIVTSGFDKTAKIWDATKKGAPLVELRGHAYEVCGASFSPDGKLVVTCGGEWRDPTMAEVKVWDALTGKFLFDLEGHNDLVHGAVFSPDGTQIVTAGWDHTAKMWDARTGALLLDLQGHAGRVHCVAYHPNGNWFITGSEDHTAKGWDSRTGALVLDLKGQDFQVFCAAFSPDGKRIVTGGGEWGEGKCGVTVWDSLSGVPLVNLPGFQGRVMSVAFSPDGTQIATAARDEVAGRWGSRIWNSRLGNPSLGELKGHTARISSVAYSPNGTRIITGSADRTAKVWDAQTQELLYSLEGHAKGVGEVSFSADGEQVITDNNGQMRVWESKTGEELKDAAIPPALHREWERKRTDWEYRISSQMLFSPDQKVFAQGMGNYVALIQVQPDMEEIAYRRLLTENVTQLNWPNVLESYLAARAAGYELVASRYLKLLELVPAKPVRAATEKAIAAGNTQYGVAILASASAAEPEDTQLLLKVAALQAWFGQDQELAETCRHRLEWAKDSTLHETAERVAKACCIRPLSDKTQCEAALALARQAVELGKDSGNLNWYLMTLGMAEYRSGHFAEADAAWIQATSMDPKHPYVPVTSAFFRAMSLFQQGKKDEARQLAIEATAQMKPLPRDQQVPLADNAAHDDLIEWLAYKEAKALIQFDAAPADSNTPVR